MYCCPHGVHSPSGQKDGQKEIRRALMRIRIRGGKVQCVVGLPSSSLPRSKESASLLNLPPQSPYNSLLILQTDGLCYGLLGGLLSSHSATSRNSYMLLCDILVSFYLLYYTRS